MEHSHDKLELARRLRIASPFYDAELNTLVPHGDWFITLNLVPLGFVSGLSWVSLTPLKLHGVMQRF